MSCTRTQRSGCTVKPPPAQADGRADWLDELATSSDWSTNVQNGSVILLHQILTGRGGPSMNRHFNRYYLHNCA